MRITIVSWHFPPVNTIAAVRLGKLARHLQLSGHDVRVITVASHSSDRSLPLEVDPKVVRQTAFVDVDRLVNPRSWYQAMRSRFGSIPRNAGDDPTHVSARSRLSELYRNLIFVPDRYVGWILPLLRELRGLSRIRPPDVILVSGPPFSAFVAVAIFARYARISWIAEFRDRWADDPYALIPSWRRSLDRRLEAWVLRTAAGLVTVSEPWSQHYARLYRLPVVTAMNGYDPQDFAGLPSDPPTTSPPLRIVYTGFVYPERRDPTQLFRALLLSGLSPGVVQILFYGSRSSYLEARIDEVGVRPYVQVHDPVPYHEAVKLQATADVLLLLQWNDPADESNVPGKVFEYLAVRRPILGLGPEKGIPAQLVRERRAGLYSNDAATIAAQLSRWVQEKVSHGRLPSLPPEVSSGLSRSEQYAKLEGFLRQVVGEASPSGRSRGSSGPTTQLVLRGPRFGLADTTRLERPVLCAIVDTEADFDWAGPFARTGHDVDSIRALRRAQVIFERFGVRPTYLADYPIMTDVAAARLLRDLHERGLCELGVQMHAWTTPPFDELLCERNSYASNLPSTLQRAKLEHLVEAALRAFGTAPRVFKAGRYGFGDKGAALLEEMGFAVDTSVLPFTRLAAGPSFFGMPDQPFWFGRTRPVLELPVTRNFTGLLRTCGPGRFYRTIDGRLGRLARLPGIFSRVGLLDRLTLSPEGMSLRDMQELTQTMIGAGRKVFTLSFHSPSLAPGNTPYVRTDAELETFLDRIHEYLEFFMGEIGGAPMTALQLHDELQPDVG
jgi:glycosyltransferase involved in cell wall biosynthesis